MGDCSATEMCISRFWSLGNPTSRHWQVHLLLWTTFWLRDGRIFAITSHGGRGRKAPWGLFKKSTNPIHEGSGLKTSHLPKVFLCWKKLHCWCCLDKWLVCLSTCFKVMGLIKPLLTPHVESLFLSGFVFICSMFKIITTTSCLWLFFKKKKQFS